MYIEAAAYWIISSTLGKYVVVPYYPRPPENPYRPNLWIIISGLPGIMRKSTVIDGVGKAVVRRAWHSYFERTNPRLTPQQINEMLSRMFIETGSYEGIAKHISEHQRDYDTFFIVSTEWGGVMQLMKNRDYMTGFATLLSKLYSGEEHLPRLVHETRYIRAGLYVTALLGMQEPWLYLDNFVFRQGLMRRVLLIYQTPEDKKRWLPPLDLSRGVHYEELTAIGDEIGELMVEYENMYPIEARFTSNAHNMINEYARSIEEQLKQEQASSNWTLYYQNMWDHATKLAVLNAIASRRPQETPTGYVVSVDEQDVKAAIDFINRHLNRAREAITLSGVPVKEKEINVVEHAEDTVLSVLRAGGGCMNTSKLLQATKLLKKELKEIVINLMEKGKVCAYTIRGKKRGRPPLIFCDCSYAKDFEAKAPGAQKLSDKAVENLW